MKINVPKTFKHVTVLTLSLTKHLLTLTGSLDLDNNGYPDLLIGCYESDTVSVNAF